MSRALVVVALAACGGASPHPAATPPRGPLPLPPVTPADEACGAELEEAPPGNRDRYAVESPDGTYGYKDLAGDFVIAPRFGYAYEFSKHGLAAAVERPAAPGGRARFVFIDPSGAEVAQAYAFDNGPDYFQEGLARIVDGAGRVGFLDRGGAVVIAPQFVDAAGFCHGAATVHDGREQWTIDRAGQAIGPRAPYVPTADPCAAD